jgi:hypothetical protein
MWTIIHLPSELIRSILIELSLNDICNLLLTALPRIPVTKVAEVVTTLATQVLEAPMVSNFTLPLPDFFFFFLVVVLTCCPFTFVCALSNATTSVCSS